MTTWPGTTIPTGMQKDAQGRPFFYKQNGVPIYVSPAAMPGGSAQPGMEWNQNAGNWQPAQNVWERAAPWLAGGLLTGGALSAFGAFSGGAAGAASQGANTLSGVATGATAPTVATAAAPAIAAAAKGFPWGSVLGSAFSVGGQLFGAKMASDANDRAAELASQSQREALDFQKQMASQEQANFITAQNANYDQWAAREKRLSPYRASGQGANQTLAGLLGLPAIDMPPPAPPPQFQTMDFGGKTMPAPTTLSGLAGSTKTTTPGGSSGVSASRGDIGGQISAYFKSRGVSDQETPYWVQKWGEFGAKDPAYFNQRLAQADIFRGR